MGLRGWVWSIGGVLTALLAGSMAVNELSRDLTALVTLLGLAASALIAEALALKPPTRRRAGALPPDEARPADGIVEGPADGRGHG